MSWFSTLPREVFLPMLHAVFSSRQKKKKKNKKKKKKKNTTVYLMLLDFVWVVVFPISTAPELERVRSRGTDHKFCSGL